MTTSSRPAPRAPVETDAEDASAGGSAGRPAGDPGRAGTPVSPADDPSAGGATAARVPVALVVLTAAAVVAGVVLRFVAPSALWLDEALSVNIARLPVGDILDALRHDGHPPLYYVLLHYWMAAVGESDTAVRALSGIFALVTLPLAFVAGRRRGGPVLGTLTLALVALSPFALRYATETRMYSMVMVLVLVGYLLVDDITRRGRDGWGRVLALAVVTGAGLLSHYWFMWLVGAVAVVLLVAWRRAGAAAARRGAGRALIGLVAGGVLFLPWVPVLLYQGKHTGTPWAGPVRPTGMLGTTLTDFGGGDFTDARFTGAVLLILALLAIFGRAVDGAHIELDLRTVPQFRLEALVVTGTIAAGLAVSYLTWSTFSSRYASVVVPIVLLLAAGGLSRFVRPGVLVAATAVVLGLSLIGAVYNVRTERTQTRALAAEVAARAQPGDLVVTCPDQLGPSTMRNFPADLEQLGYPDLEAPDRVDWVDYTTRLAQADPAAVARDVLARAGAGRDVFVVWSAGYKTHQGDCERFLAALGEQRPGQALVAEDGDRFYEHASLTWFPAPA